MESQRATIQALGNEERNKSKPMHVDFGYFINIVFSE